MQQRILFTKVECTSYSAATAQILDWARQHESRSVYAANVHMLMEAHDHADFQQIVNQADLVTPDGMPLVWALRLKGQRAQQRVYGPTLMLSVLQAAAQARIPVGFLGSTDAILARLSEKMLAVYPDLQIAVCLPLPFRPQTQAEEQALRETINSSGARILFVALGCPKQERWISAQRGKMDAVMLGVGAAFAFHAGAVKQAPSWMQKLGLEWLFRLNQEPGRLWRRYWLNNPRFVLLLLVELIQERFQKHARPGGSASC
jgi:bacterial polymer biosynthesis proteins, WecB/TagA/CpsF family